MIGGISEEDTSHGAWGDFMARGGSSAGVAEAAKNTEQAVVGGNPEQELVRRVR